jgi:orotidine-5'-phosphate decarboxylase
MRKIATLMILILSGSLSADARRKGDDTFKWISDHVQTVSYKVTTPLATYVEDQSAKVEFSGCNAKITEDLKSHKIDIQTTVSFDLKDIQPDMIRFHAEKGVGDTQVSEYFVIQLPLVNSVTSNTVFRTSDGSRTDSSASNTVSIVLPDLDAAEGQASAWRDASRACGAIDSISASNMARAPSFGQK